jgi:hypothetical protein
MNGRRNIVSFIRYVLTGILACGLIFSLGLHTIQVEHSHFTMAHGETREHEHKQDFASLDVYMHLSEKKLFIFIPTVILLSSFFAYVALLLRVRTLMLANWYARMMQKQSARKSRIHDYHSYFLRKGIVHSKAY